MKTVNIFLAALIAAFSMGQASAQESMTLEKCRELALRNNNSIAIAEHNKEKAEYTRRAYRANYLPKFSASGNYIYTSSKISKTLAGNYLPTFVPDPVTGQLVPNILTIGSDGTPIFKEYAYFPDMDLKLKLSGTWAAGLQAEQPIYAGGKVGSAYRMSRIGEQIASLNRELTRAEVILKTDEAYWTYVQANEMVKLAQSYKEVVGKLLQDVQNAQEVGLKHKNDVLKVQVRMNEAELQLRQAENGWRLACKNLCYTIGLPLHTLIALPDSHDSAPVVIDRRADHTSRPEYAMLEQQLLLKEQEVRLTRSDFLPQVGLMANYGYANGLKLNGDKLLDRASFSAVASVSIPLFQWGEGRNKVRAAKAEQEMIRAQKDDISQQMELELAKALDKCDEAAFEVALTDRSLEQAEENMKVSEDSYAAGMETLANHLEAQTVWQRAWAEHIRATTNLRLNQTYYLKTVGKL